MQCFGASIEFVQTLRQMGHWGIAINHYAFDRALHAPLVRRFKQHHTQLASAWVAPTGAEAGVVALCPPSVLEWIVDTPCCNHDVHNGLKWGLFQFLTDEPFMTEVFTVIESVRNGFPFWGKSWAAGWSLLSLGQRPRTCGIQPLHWLCGAPWDVSHDGQRSLHSWACSGMDSICECTRNTGAPMTSGHES